MQELTASNPNQQRKKIDPAAKAAGLAELQMVTNLVNDPGVKAGAAPGEDMTTVAMLAEAMGGPSPAEQAAQAQANPSLMKRKAPPQPPKPSQNPASLPPLTPAPSGTVDSRIATSVSASALSPAVSSVPVEGFIVASATQSASPLKIFFTGRSGVGKTFLADLLSARLLEFNDPLRKIINGLPNLPGPEVVKLLAWGNGVYSEATPNTLERMLFVHAVRSGFLGDGDFKEFGAEGWTARYLVDLCGHQMDALIVVTDVCTPEEYESLKAAGFVHFHVACSQTTLATRSRRAKPQDKLGPHLDGQAAQRIQKEPQGEKIPVVWCDPITPSPSPRFYTPEEFVTKVGQLQNPSFSPSPSPVGVENMPSVL